MMTKHTVKILWGECPDDDAEPDTYEFNTEAERMAFLQGVSEADGWAAATIDPEQCKHCGSYVEGHDCPADGMEDEE